MSSLVHRQFYAGRAEERTSPSDKDVHVAAALKYYRDRRDSTFSTRANSLDLMDDRHYYLAFRGRLTKCNGRMWAYPLPAGRARWGPGVEPYSDARRAAGPYAGAHEQEHR